MMRRFRPDPKSEAPVYRQVFEYLKDEIVSGHLPRGSRLPATRKLAEDFGLNRSTILAAFALLEEHRLIRSFVGRGSFVVGKPPEPSAPSDGIINFASGRPLADSHPVELFRLSAEEVLAQQDLGAVLQLGSSYGYAPLRRYLIEQARQAEVAGPEDEVLITSGCQQALDLLQRVLIRPGDAVAIEDPVYPGLKNLFLAAGARVVGIPLTEEGMALDYLERVVERERPKMLVVTPNFQNPTGVCLGMDERARIVNLCESAGITLVENDTYAGMRYRGATMPGLKAMAGAEVVLLRTFSKVSFPGLRVGWVVGPRGLLARLAEAKKNSDLHSDHLSQAILLRFAESGRLEAHLERVKRHGLQQLDTMLTSLKRSMPEGAFWTEPEGGMNVWVRLPDPIDTSAAAERAAREGVTYLPGRYFEVSRPASSALRLNFSGLSLEEIRVGIETLGRIFKEEMVRTPPAGMIEPSPILV